MSFSSGFLSAVIFLDRSGALGRSGKEWCPDDKCDPGFSLAPSVCRSFHTSGTSKLDTIPTNLHAHIYVCIEIEVLPAVSTQRTAVVIHAGFPCNREHPSSMARASAVARHLSWKPAPLGTNQLYA